MQLILKALVLMTIGTPAMPRTVAAQDVREVAGSLPFQVVEPEALGLDSDKLAELVRLTRGWSEQNRIVGAEMLIIKNGRIALHETVGWSDLEARKPMTRGSVFRLRSMTKPFTGTAALMLVDQGLLDLDAPVARYLPSWRNPRSQAITVEHLLTHFSGFEQGGTPEPAWTYESLLAVVDAAGEQGPQGRPGESFVYSDVNTFTLGTLVTSIVGIPLDQFIRERIIRRLGLDHLYVGFSADTEWVSRMNPTYDRDESGAWEKYWAPGEDLRFSWFRASGGMFSSAQGYARWLEAWLDPSTETGVALGGPGGLLGEPLAATAIQKHGADDAGGYGYHWEVWEEPLIFGHGGSDGTLGVAVPSQQLILLYFTQSRGHDTRDEWLQAALEATQPSS